MCHGFGLVEIVEGDYFQIVRIVVQDSLKNLATNTAKAVNTYANRHDGSPCCVSWKQKSRIASAGRLLSLLTLRQADFVTGHADMNKRCWRRFVMRSQQRLS